MGTEQRQEMKRVNICSLLIRISLIANIGILLPVCTALIVFSTSVSVEHSWGPSTPARGILLSVYFSILFASMALLGLHIYFSNKTVGKSKITTMQSTSNQQQALAAIEHMVTALLLTQILYTISTPATAGVTNPVALSNLCICVLHSATHYYLYLEHFAMFTDLHFTKVEKYGK